MMINRIALLVLIAAGMVLAACSSTMITGSWKNPDFTGKVEKVYVVGIAKQETTRRIFEDGFSKQLATLGATGIPSYDDLKINEETDQDVIAARIKTNGADSVLMARAVGKRTEQVVNPGYVSGPGYGGRGYYPDPYYRNYGGYYSRSYDVVYQPATVSEYQIITIEANLYSAASGELIWSAQLETVVEANLDALINDFIAVVTKDLKDKGLL
jgi:hypothetical protein